MENNMTKAQKETAVAIADAVLNEFKLLSNTTRGRVYFENKNGDIFRIPITVAELRLLAEAVKKGK